MPLARDKPYLYADGKKEDVHVAALIVPEVNQQELLQGGTGQLRRTSNCVYYRSICRLQIRCCAVLLTACGWHKCYKSVVHAVFCKRIALSQHSA
jgi:hypothetical protein